MPTLTARSSQSELPDAAEANQEDEFNLGFARRSARLPLAI